MGGKSPGKKKKKDKGGGGGGSGSGSGTTSKKRKEPSAGGGSGGGSSSTRAGKGPGEKEKRVKVEWSEDQEALLIEAVKKAGAGKWKQIVEDPGFDFEGKTGSALQSKWRTLSRRA